MNITDLWNIILINPIVNILIAFYNGLNFLHFPAAFALSVLILTILVRLALWPLTAAQLKSAKKMADLRPELAKIKTEHGHDKVRHQQEQMKLYKEHGVNPAAGCLPLLLQMPIFIALYNVFWTILGNGLTGAALTERINNSLYFPFLKLSQPIDINFFGISLASKPSSWQSLGWWLLLIPVITALLQLFQSKMMVPSPVKLQPNDTPGEKKEKEDTSEMMVQMQGQMLFLMPIMFGFFAFQFPIGLAVYWNTFTILGMVQQYQIAKWGGLTDWLHFLKGR